MPTKPMDQKQIEDMNLRSKQPVVEPNPDEEVREYTVQHTLISLQDGRYLHAGDQVSSDELRGAVGTEEQKAASERRFVEGGAVMLTKTVTRKVAEQRAAAAAPVVPTKPIEPPAAPAPAKPAA